MPNPRRIRVSKAQTVQVQAGSPGLAFPRVSTRWWSAVPDITDMYRYDYLRCDTDYPNASAMAAARAANPDIHLTLYQDVSAQVMGAYPGHTAWPHLNGCSADWIVTLRGSTLAADVSASTTTITVAAGEGSRFVANRPALICGSPGSGFTNDKPGARTAEVINVTNVSGDTLTVGRAACPSVWPAKTWAAGTRIATCATIYPPYTFWMDVTSYCQPVDVGSGSERWNDFWPRVAAINATSTFGSFDGVWMDDAKQQVYTDIYNQMGSRYVDVGRTNTNPTASAFDALNLAWNDGITTCVTNLRSRLGGTPTIVGNYLVASSGNYANANGYYSESEYRYGDCTLSQWETYSLTGWGMAGCPNQRDWMNGCTREPYWSCIASDTNSSDDAHIQNMRMALGTACLFNSTFGVLHMVTSGSGTGHTIWLDEFDGGGSLGRGWLGYPVSAAAELPTTSSGGSMYTNAVADVWAREFTNGWVLVNPNHTTTATITLGRTLQRLTGAQVPSVNSGASVSSVTLQASDGLFLRK